ncbi:MAG: succinate dehydrogenase, cytochrome b556 subunit [Betaproteobacteria bacterium RIFCSPLOWO2_12_FULL_62_13]|nr:MAG: succinate dehydrogenase, cytochrome b556 subunit [Betaproteobacteria bacterium RIFCSPLOWO2_12_FULL_62_13]
MPKSRPKHLNLLTIRFPVMAVVSGMHRISGAVLFLFLPLFLWLWQETLGSRESFETFRSVVSNPLMKIILLGLLWGYLHHLCAGIRHLALDLHLGIELAAARASSVAVLVASIGLTVIAGVALW